MAQSWTHQPTPMSSWILETGSPLLYTAYVMKIARSLERIDFEIYGWVESWPDGYRYTFAVLNDITAASVIKILKCESDLINTLLATSLDELNVIFILCSSIQMPIPARMLDTISKPTKKYLVCLCQIKDRLLPPKRIETQFFSFSLFISFPTIVIFSFKFHLFSIICVFISTSVSLKFYILW